MKSQWKITCEHCGHDMDPPAELKEVHCWEEGPRYADGVGSTCMLEEGHDGEHEFVRDDQILLRFN